MNGSSHGKGGKNQFGHTEKTDNGPGEKWNQNRVSVCLSLILRESLKVTDGDRAAGSGDRNRQKGTWA